MTESEGSEMKVQEPWHHAASAAIRAECMWEDSGIRGEGSEGAVHTDCVYIIANI